MQPSREDYLKYLRRQQDYRQYGGAYMQATASTKVIIASYSDMGRSLYRRWTCKTLKAGEVN